MSNSLQSHGSQHTRPLCPSPTPRVYPNPCPSSWWFHPAISSSVIPFSSCPQSFPALGSFPLIQLFTWGGQSIGVSASASVLPMNTQDWSFAIESKLLKRFLLCISYESELTHVTDCSICSVSDLLFCFGSVSYPSWHIFSSLGVGNFFYSPWSSLGQNTGVGNLSLLQGIFPTQGSNPGLLHSRWILYQLSHKGSPRILEWVAYPFSRGSSWPRNQTGVSCIAEGFFTNWAVRETHPFIPYPLS